MSLIIKPQVSDQELRPFVEKILQEQGEDAAGLTVEDVLHSKVCRGLKSLAVLSWQNEQKQIEAERRADEARKQAQLDREKAEKVAKIEAKLREQLGLKILTPEELKDQIPKIAKSEAENNEEQGPWIPAEVTALAEKFGDLLPAFVFKSDARAVTFRGWLGKRNNRCRDELANPADPSPEYRQAVIKRDRQIKELMNAVTQVVKAWGLDPKTAKTERPDFLEMCRHMEVEGGRFYWLIQPPVVETPEAQVARQEADIVAEAVAEAKQKQWEELKNSLKARLLEVDSALSAKSAEKLAKRLAKKYSEMSDAKTIFCMDAVNRMAKAGDNEFEQLAAKRLAKAGGMTDQEFEVEVRAYTQVNAAEIQAQADEKAAKLRDPNYGAIKPATIIARAAKKNNKKKVDGKKGNKGQKNGS